MPFKPITREALLEEARERGRRWGDSQYNQFGGFVRHGFPAMHDLVTRRTAYETVAEILPIDDFGESLVLACYEAARDVYNARVAVGKQVAKELKLKL